MSCDGMITDGEFTGYKFGTVFEATFNGKTLSKTELAQAVEKGRAAMPQTHIDIGGLPYGHGWKMLPDGTKFATDLRVAFIPFSKGRSIAVFSDSSPHR